MELATKDTLILFKGCYYKQIEGVAMGSPLGPILANIFLCHNENRWLSDCPEVFKPVKYLRYVDDTFLLFSDVSHVKQFSDYLNKQHINIRFTEEIEKNNELPFLDVNVMRSENTFITGVYRKSTFSGLYSNYRSLIPDDYKFGLIITLLYRSFELVCDYKMLDHEITLLKSILSKNQYPQKFVDRVIYSFLNKKFLPSKTYLTVPKKKIRIILPYLGNTSIKIRTKLKQMLKKLPGCQLEIIFQCNFRIGNMFRFKDRFPDSIVSNIVYLYKCRSCAASYVGRTFRHKKVRYCEHAGISARTGKPLRETIFNASAIKTHMFESTHEVNVEDFKIISNGGSSLAIDIKESIMIGRLKPSLNNNIKSAVLYLY